MCVTGGLKMKRVFVSAAICGGTGSANQGVTTG